jgi:hypothetical protein
VSRQCTESIELSHCTENYKCKPNRDPLTGWPQATSAEPVEKGSQVARITFRLKANGNTEELQGVGRVRMDATEYSHHSHQLVDSCSLGAATLRAAAVAAARA